MSDSVTLSRRGFATVRFPLVDESSPLEFAEIVPPLLAIKKTQACPC